MSSFNKAIIIGHCGQDPEIKNVLTGCIANVSVATTYNYTDKRSGEKIKKTEWHRITTFNKLAEIVRDYVRKGDKILVEGRLQTNKWISKGGEEHYATEIIASNLKMLGSKNKSLSDNKENSIDDDLPF